MNDEKISLRIEGEELARIEAYLDAHPEAGGSRSLFIKNCIREKLDRDAQPIAETRASPNTVTLTLPGRYMAALERMVAEEYATSVNDALLMLVRDSMREVQADARSAAVDGSRRAFSGTE